MRKKKEEAILDDTQMMDSIIMSKFVQMLDDYKHTLNRDVRTLRDSILVYWSPPMQGLFKLNVDGSSCDNRGNVAYKDLIKDEHEN